MSEESHRQIQQLQADLANALTACAEYEADIIHHDAELTALREQLAAAEVEVARLTLLGKALVGEETLWQDGKYETEMQKLSKRAEAAEAVVAGILDALQERLDDVDTAGYAECARSDDRDFRKGEASEARRCLGIAVKAQQEGGA